jgi:biopolymer transport protein ExbD
MKASMRARRMARNHRRMKAAAKLTLVPIIDIFTMLLFFLMMNTGNVEVLELDKTIKLPDSTAQKRAEERLLIKINADDIIVQGQKVANVADVMAAHDDVIAPLQKQLDVWASRKLDVSAEEKERGHAVTIMGDQKIPYRLLKRVMTTCAQADFRDIALAVAGLPEGAAPPNNQSQPRGGSQLPAAPGA